MAGCDLLNQAGAGPRHAQDKHWEFGSIAPLPPLREARRDASDIFERAYVEALLTRTSGNMKTASAMSEVSRQMIQKLIRKHGLG